jgi:hypothetical protein
VLAASIIRATRGVLNALMLEAASTSETSVHFYQTFCRNNPQDSHIENLQLNFIQQTVFYE